MKLKSFLLKLAGIAIIAGVFTSAVTGSKDIQLDLIRSSVMITTTAGNSGGSGVILKSSPMYSFVLTNRHVCRVIPEGGFVKTWNHSEYYVNQMIESTVHDLCVIKVNADLRENTRVATKSPDYNSMAYISGHPILLPTIVSSGRFAGKSVVEVASPDPKCDNPFVCMPTFERFQVEVVSALIQPGSSGSGVFNDKGELSGLAFAGSGMLGYAMVVPLEYIHEFLLIELKEPSLL